MSLGRHHIVVRRILDVAEQEEPVGIDRADQFGDEVVTARIARVGGMVGRVAARDVADRRDDILLLWDAGRY